MPLLGTTFPNTTPRYTAAKFVAAPEFSGARKRHDPRIDKSNF
jgi:hypothetical protein